MTAEHDFGHDDDGPRPVSRFEWERLIRRARLPWRVKLLAFVLATYADANGTRIRPGVELLSSDTEQSESSVKRSLRMLREDYRLIVQVRAGGGRSGRGKAAEYRLVFPDDLLERLELTPLPGFTKVTTLTPVSDLPVEEPPDTEVNDGTHENDFHRSDDADTEVSGETHENDFHGSEMASHGGMRGQKRSFIGQPADLLPSDQAPKDDHELGCDPTEPPPARELRPAKCPHGLAAHQRDDGTPTCPICRRGLPGKDPT